jgi:Rad3-related DNA helicase
MPLHDYRRYFPFKEIRKEQKEAIEFAINSYESGKKYVLLELGTGTGKSAIGITIARYLENNFPTIKDENGDALTGAYVLTTQKILQDQYVRDFGPGSKLPVLRTIKSSSNYACSFYDDQSCAESKMLLSRLAKNLSGTEFQNHCTKQCQYSQEKQEFIDSSVSITNFSYFLAETSYSGKLGSRGLLVIDEAHNVESEVGRFIEVSFSEKFSNDVLKIKPPKSQDQKSIFDWIKTSYLKSLKKYSEKLESTLKKNTTSLNKCKDASKNYEMIQKHQEKVEKFIEVYNPKSWVMNLEKKLYGQGKTTNIMSRFEFKTVDVSPYCEKHLFSKAPKILMMSATIVDKDIFCESIGLKPSEVAYMKKHSPFSDENRPIHFMPVGSMSKNKIDSTLPILVEAIKMLLDKHKEDKGIIHTVNYKISKYLIDSIKSDRLLSHDASNRDKVLKDHINSENATVLISPSMMEGVDLSDNLSRFQIICKVPFPYLGDEVVKKRLEKNETWYSYATAKSLIQSLGRSIRNENDFAISYILDSDWTNFFNKNKRMFEGHIGKVV